MNSISSQRTFAHYEGLLNAALPDAGYLLADASGQPVACFGPGTGSGEDWLRSLKPAAGRDTGLYSRSANGQTWLAMELKQDAGSFAGWLMVSWSEIRNPQLWPDPAAVVANRLLPVLPLLARELAGDVGSTERPVPAAVSRAAAPAQPEFNALVDWLREALEQNRIRLFAQRIMPLQDFKKPSGYELLVRLRDEDGLIVSPEEFLSTAYRYQLLPTVDRWVMEHAIEMLGPVSTLLRRSDISIAINVSGQSLGDRLFVQRLAERLAASGIPPQRIMLEIAEHTAMADLAQAATMMGQLRDIGCGVALDDAGNNPSSIAVLAELPVSRVKLDRAIVRDIMTNPRSEDTARALVQEARARKFETVAVFVENEHVARKVRALGIDYGQGYMFAKPEPLEQVLELMRKDVSRRVNIAET